MQWITLIGDKSLNLNEIKRIKHYGSIDCYDVLEMQYRYCVDYGQEHIFYDDQGATIGDYEETDLIRIPYENPHFVMMIYTSEEIVKKVIRQKNYLTGIFIDNGYDLIVPIEEFIRLGMPMGNSLHIAKTDA